MRITPWLVAALAVFSAWRLYSSRDIEHSPGVLAVADPVQREIDSTTSIERGEFRLRPRAEFEATVRILHREDYSLGELADLAPTDFAVGWGPMSDSAVLEHIEISQANRFYFWRTETWPIGRKEIETHSANWHVIPENDRVSAVLSGCAREVSSSCVVVSSTSKVATVAFARRCRATTLAPAPARSCSPPRRV